MQLDCHSLPVMDGHGSRAARKPSNDDCQQQQSSQGQQKGWWTVKNIDPNAPEEWRQDLVWQPTPQ